MRSTLIRFKPLVFLRTILTGFVLLLGCTDSYTQQVSVIRNSDFSDLKQISLVDSVWYFTNQSTPSLPAFDRNRWDSLRGTSFGNDGLPAHWTGTGWFGIWIRVEQGLVGRALSIRVNHDGASAFYVDGKLIGGYGKVGANAAETENKRAPRRLILFSLDDTLPHFLRLHYANFNAAYPDFYGFQVSVGDYAFASNRYEYINDLLDTMPAFAAAQLVLALLHLMLFLFYRKQRLNLYYAMLVGLIGINRIGIYLYLQTTHPSTQFWADVLTWECKVGIMWAGVILLHSLNATRIARWRLRAIGAISILYMVFYAIKFIYFPAASFNDFFTLVYLVCFLDGMWSVYKAVKQKRPYSWLITTGVVSIVALYFFIWADVFHLWTYRMDAMRLFVMSAGELVLPICLSLYLAIDFSQTNQRLTAKLTEVEALSAKALAQEAEKRELLANEAKRLEAIVDARTIELREKADQLKVLDEAKSRFFANITHEFKTPLTLIINPAKELLAYEDTAAYAYQLRLILNNANRLLGLINQLLDISKIENGSMEVRIAPLNLTELIASHVESWQPVARQKGILLQFRSAGDDTWLSTDRSKIDTIVLNLLSNAIKFTADANVDVILETTGYDTDRFCSLTVRDEGAGIPADKLPFIFERFYQADPSDTRAAEGTGIGLALTKDLVELLGGRITATSTAGIFTEVNVRLPYTVVSPAAISATYPGTATLPVINTGLIPAWPQEDKPLILVVEDHAALRQFISYSLQNRYTIIAASNGREGMALSLQQIPDLVITDLMMPLVDGIELCTRLRQDEKTSHIPVVMLTAKGSTDSRIRGLESGADAYLGKPFDQRELVATIDNLLQSRRQLREYYSRHLWTAGSQLLPPVETDFLEKVRTAVQDHLDQPGYGADQLARDMNLSRTQLHRKIKGLIDQAPGELIRTIRLQQAHALLQRPDMPVAEVAYMVGFSSPAAFSASFSRHFGYPPRKVSEK